MKNSLRNYFLIFLALLFSAPTHAHEMSMAEMELRETAHGEFLWQWTATSDRRRSVSEDLTPRWPEPCVADASNLHCNEKGLSGALTIDGVGKNYSAVIVKINWLGGEQRVYTLTGSQPSVQLYGSADDKRSRIEIASAYLKLGVEHILTGFDHLLFVFSLLFLVGFQRKLVWTITAFTLAHSVTLASAATGFLVLRSPPVEASIALSIVLVAGEALQMNKNSQRRLTLAQRWPVLVAFLFGLVHGLGFAGALKEIGLPHNYLPTALLCFNVGVEIGQLMTVCSAWLLYRLLSRWPAAKNLRTPLLYGIGSIAAYWSWLRIAAIVLR